MEAQVTGDFAIQVLSWLDGFYGPEEIRRTAAQLQITIGGKNATRVEDEWSQSVQQSVRVPVYPLALWLASSWWRLRWEPAPFRNAVHGVSWRMAHEMPAAGHGYLWPLLTFDSDGESVQVECRPSDAPSPGPVRYLEKQPASVKGSHYERVIDEFIRLTLARLDAVGLANTHLHELWSEIRREREDPDLTAVRKLEAQLGYEPDEAPDGLLKRLAGLSATAGAMAVAEIATLCAGVPADRTVAEIGRIEAFAEEAGADGRISSPPGLSRKSVDNGRSTLLPWQRGWRLASETRRAFGFGGGPLTDEKVAGMLGLPEASLKAPLAGKAPLGLAVRGRRSDKVKILFHKWNRPGLRFEAARLFADHILTPLSEIWLPATDTRTARQKVQRAFAAELLCPIEDLKGLLDGDYSPQSIDAAIEDFGVSVQVVEWQLTNHGLVPAGVMTL